MLSVALLDATLEQLAEALSLTFEDVEFEGTGHHMVRAAEICTADGVYAVLECDPLSPSPGVEILIRWGTKDLAQALSSVLRALENAHVTVVWRRPDAS